MFYDRNGSIFKSRVDTLNFYDIENNLRIRIFEFNNINAVYEATHSLPEYILI